MDPHEVLRRDGMLLQSARGPIPNHAELVAGERIRGSWWSHPRRHEIFEAINAARASPDVVALRLVDRKITLVHRTMWPALVRLADRFPADALAAVHEEHTATGAHASSTVAFPDWVPADVMTAAARLSEDDARAGLPACIRPDA
jgi:hypothetical protein